MKGNDRMKVIIIKSSGHVFSSGHNLKELVSDDGDDDDNNDDDSSASQTLKALKLWDLHYESDYDNSRCGHDFWWWRCE